MGAWGTVICQDDFVCDIGGAFEDQLKDGKTIAEATKFVHEQYANAIDNCDDVPQSEWDAKQNTSRIDARDVRFLRP